MGSKSSKEVLNLNDGEIDIEGVVSDSEILVDNDDDSDGEDNSNDDDQEEGKSERSESEKLFKPIQT